MAESVVDLSLQGMHCASCVSTIEKALASVDGVTAASVNLGTSRARVEGEDLDTARLVEAVRQSGYGASPLSDRSPDDDRAREKTEVRDALRRTIVAALLTLPVLIISMATARTSSWPGKGSRSGSPSTAGRTTHAAMRSCCRSSRSADAFRRFGKTEVTVVPERTGGFPFSCGMNMLHGMIRVVD